MGALSAVDLTIVVLYLAATVFIGWWVSTYIHTGREFFLAGRTLPWWAVGVSLVATDIGGTDLIGVGGTAYRYGMAVANFEWIGCIPAMIVAGFVVIPHLWRCGVTTIPEFLERRFNVQVRTMVAVCWVIFMACNLGIMLLASAKLMVGLAGWSVPFSIVLIATLVCFYTWSGGLAAVVYTDVLQGILMIAGCALIVVIGLQDVGGPEQLRTRVQEVVTARAAEAAPPSSGAPQPPPQRFEHFSLILPVDTPSPFPWPGILFGLAFVISPAYWIGNQAIVQRALGARSDFEAKASYVWGAVLKTVIPLVIVIPGLIALAQHPRLDDPDTALPTLIARSMPVGVKGVFVAAFLAALMSSVDSYLNCAATIVTNDLYLRFIRPSADERRVLQIGRICTLAFTAWAVIFALQLQSAQAGVYALFQTLLSFFNGPAFAVLLLGLVTGRIAAAGAAWGFAAGVLTAIGLYVLNHPLVISRFQWKPLFQIQEPFLYYSIWAFLMTVVVSSAVSYFSNLDPPEKRAYALGRSAGGPR